MTVNIDSLLVNGIYTDGYSEETVYTYEDSVLTVRAILLALDVGQCIGEEVDGDYFPAWPIESIKVFSEVLSTVTWTKCAYGRMIGYINNPTFIVSLHYSHRYELTGSNHYVNSGHAALYHLKYGWIPCNSGLAGGLIINYENIDEGYSYAYPSSCPVQFVNELSVIYRPGQLSGAVWLVDGIEYMADGSKYINMSELIHAYSVSVPKKLNATIPEAMCIGIEMEFSKYSGLSMIATLASVGNKALFKEDSSCGIELVSVPLLPHQMIQFINGLDISSMDVDKSCGVHLHLSRKYLTQSQLGGLVVFMNHPDNLSYIQEVAGRNPNKYCKQVPGKVDTTSVDRYEMVNLTNSDTVEIRIFAGTNDTSVLRGYVEWLLKLIEWLGTNPSSYLAAESIKYQSHRKVRLKAK